VLEKVILNLRPGGIPETAIDELIAERIGEIGKGQGVILLQFRQDFGQGALFVISGKSEIRSLLCGECYGLQEEQNRDEREQQ